MPFKISEKYQNTDWKSLNLLDDNNVNWTDGISIIEDRFFSRFFSQIEKIKDDEFSGFVVMSIDCLLIETLMQFYLGIDNTEVNYKSVQWKAFKDFFKNSTHFNADFKTNNICKTFYQQFRCGLLHQAQTKEKSLIKICQTSFLTLADAKNVKVGLIIDRTQFHNKLFSEFNEYIQKLIDNKNNFAGENLRIKAILKMDLICKE
ncbi:hypothetical protein HNQ02_003829 [Flavobacterium sp. 7E]|uniref:hypothetical protein n=1 Tax=Flavobacterium sp. 7E TaxID=2735898 RepID=UPI0015714593|nr:hypothetical protein [Flavobacterium sp. 7E]NRS90882.1 hypothetical protein [Flavobacterium sp. 7E]